MLAGGGLGWFWLVVVVQLIAVGAGWNVARDVSKALLMPLLAGWAVRWGDPRLLAGALMCGWGGDVLLEVGGTGPFLAGMGCFAAGHVCYLRMFVRHGAFAGPRKAVRVRCGVYAAVTFSRSCCWQAASWPRTASPRPPTAPVPQLPDAERRQPHPVRLPPLGQHDPQRPRLRGRHRDGQADAPVRPAGRQLGVVRGW